MPAKPGRKRNLQVVPINTKAYKATKVSSAQSEPSYSIQKMQANKVKATVKRTQRTTTQKQRSFTSTVSREHRVTDASGRTVSDIFTCSQEQSVIEAEIKETIDEFSQTKIQPALLGLTSLQDSSILQMFDNRFDMAFAQKNLMEYRPGKLTFGSKQLLLTSGSDVSNSSDLSHLQQFVYKPQLTMTRAYTRQNSMKLLKYKSESDEEEKKYTPPDQEVIVMKHSKDESETQPRKETCNGPGFYLIDSREDQDKDPIKLDYPIFRGLNTFEWDHKLHGHLTRAESVDVIPTKQVPVEEDGPHWSHLKRFYKRHISNFGRFNILWQKVFMQPLTVDELLRMTLCRYVARMRNISMPLVDQEEFIYPYPITSIDIDIQRENHTETDPNTTNRFGTVQTIIRDLTSVPLSGIHSSQSSSQSVQDKNMEEHLKPIDSRSDTEFEVAVGYKVPGHAKMYRMNTSLVFQYGKLRANQRNGQDISIDLQKLQTKMKTEDLESMMYDPIPNQGMILSGLALDLTAIGKIRHYITWCKAKRESKIQTSLLNFNNDSAETRESITKLEYALLSARKTRADLLHQDMEEQYKDLNNFVQEHPSLKYHSFIDPSKEKNT
jgi:hypothetical protein